jgi:hypothetical protein
MIDPRQANKAAYKKYCDTFRINASGGLFSACKEFHRENAAIHVTAPINFVNGFAGLYEALYQPLLYAMPDLYRRTELLFSGNAKGGDWVTGQEKVSSKFCLNKYYLVLVRKFLIAIIIPIRIIK